MTSFGINKNCAQHIKKSSLTHFEGTNDELIELLAISWDKRSPLVPDEIFRVPVPAARFFSPVIRLKDNARLVGAYAPRNEGEAPIQHIRTFGEKTPAVSVTLIVYKNKTLGKEATTEKDYEIVNINAEIYTTDSPPHPLVMMRNQTGLIGGAHHVYTAEEWATSTRFWCDHALVVTPEPAPKEDKALTVDEIELN